MAATTTSIPQTGVITVKGATGSSYDPMYTDARFQIPERQIFQINTDQIREVHQGLMVPYDPADLHTRMLFSDIVTKIRERYYNVGPERMTLNFECCSEYHSAKEGHNCFKTSELSKHAMHFMVFMLSKGAQVICADFALKALIATWDSSIFGVECPLVQTGHTSGKINVKFGISACRESVLPALNSIAHMAVDDGDPLHPGTSHISMTAMSHTITYAVKKTINPKLNVKVMSIEEIAPVRQTEYKPYTAQTLSVASISPFTTISAFSSCDDPTLSCTKLDETKATDDSGCAYEISTAYGTELKGMPIHVEISFADFPGSLVVSSTHLINLTGVHASSSSIYETCARVAGPEVAEKMASQLAEAEAEGPLALATAQSECVRNVGAFSSQVPPQQYERAGKTKPYASSPS